MSEDDLEMFNRSCEAALVKDNDRQRAEIERLRMALAEIRDHWACQYDHPRKQDKMYSGSYGIGVTDGHRAASSIAKKALGTPDEQP